MRASVFAIVAAVAGCGPHELVDAELDEVCGQAGPVRLLALDDDELFAGSVTNVDDRLYFVVGEAVTQADAPFDENPYLDDTPTPAHRRVVSTGLCGESPRPIAEGVREVHEDSRWPSALLGRADPSGDIVVLDPLGVAAPRVLVPELPGVGSELGLVGVIADGADAPSGTLVLQPYPASADDPPPSRVELLADVAADGSGLAVRDDAAFVRTIDGTVLRVELVDGAIETVVEDVVDFLVSRDASMIAFHTAAAPEGSEELLPTFVLDRDTGTRTWIADSLAGWHTNVFDDELEVETGADFGLGSRIIDVPSLATHDIPAGVSIFFRVTDERHLAAADGEFVLFDVATGDAMLLFAGLGPFASRPDALDVLDVDWLGAPDYQRRTGALWRAPYDGSAPERLAHRAAPRHSYLADGRILTPVDIDEAYLGTLVLVDSESLEEQRIDEDVFVEGVTLGADGTFAPGTIAYGVRDGERSGIWLAKPAAP